MEVLNETSNQTTNQTAIDEEMRFTILEAVSWTVLVVALPATLMAIYGLCFFIKADHVAPVYVINLLVSDVAQLSGNALSTINGLGMMYALYYVGLIASAWFMLCIAAERYIMIAYPVFYRNHRTIKKACLVSATVWVAAIVAVVMFSEIEMVDNYRTVPFMLPFPFLVFFLFRTWRVLSKIRSLSPRKQRQVLGTLALVLCIYMLFFLPYIVIDLIIQHKEKTWFTRYLHLFSEVFLSLNPLLDTVLYVFMRKDAKDIFRAFPCLSRVQKCRELLETHPTDDTAVMESAERFKSRTTASSNDNC
ncbi:hypothetical protein ACEWY4_021160 [Coilia grayii]|uniref:G-protein coupled receptors family 1 profile domain-containing protein n=1 Tax=Coilia grayii TaxID=363190 RepID=A0ABD1J872_9TELE